MRGIAVIAAIIAACAALPASAGTLYRCVGDNGIPAIVDSPSKKPAGAKCETIGNYASGTGSRATVITQADVATPVATVPVGHDEPVVPTRAPVDASVPPQRVSKQFYSYIQNGVRSYGDAAPQGQYGSLRKRTYTYIENCYACGNPRLDFGAVALNTTAYSDEIRNASRQYGVDESIVRAIIHAESAFRWNARSRVGAQGLMQLMPGTARRFGVQDAYDAAQNIRGGVQYLAWLLRRYDNNLSLAAASYNAGEGAVDRHGGVPPYGETRLYVQRVGLLADRYRRRLAAN